MEDYGHKKLVDKILYKSNYRGVRENELIFRKFNAEKIVLLNMNELELYLKLLDEDDYNISILFDPNIQTLSQYSNLVNKIKMINE